MLPYQLAEKIRHVLFPPNPNELDMTLRMFAPDPKTFAGEKPSSFISDLKFKFGKIHLFLMAIILKTASIAPAAPKVCPV
jgi:hypothetical protein